MHDLERCIRFQHETVRECTVHYNKLLLKYIIEFKATVLAFVEFTIISRQQITFEINLLHLDIDMAPYAEAVVELLDDMHRGNNDSISYN